MEKATRRNSAKQGTTTPEFLTDPEAAALLKLGMTRFLELQKADPGFPSPVWFGPRGKRHVRERLITWALAQTERESA